MEAKTKNEVEGSPPHQQMMDLDDWIWSKTNPEWTTYELKKAYVLQATKPDETFTQRLAEVFAKPHPWIQEADFWKHLTFPKDFKGVRNPSVRD